MKNKSVNEKSVPNPPVPNRAKTEMKEENLFKPTAKQSKATNKQENCKKN